MFSFNGLLFDPDIRTLGTDSYIIAVMLGIATFFILLVLAWLIQYMIRFMMKKRSREFATYLLLGMKRRQITHIFWGESLALGANGLSAWHDHRPFSSSSLPAFIPLSGKATVWIFPGTPLLF